MLGVIFKTFLVCGLLQELGGSELYGNPLSWALWFTELCILAAARVVQEPFLVMLIAVSCAGGR